MSTNFQCRLIRIYFDADQMSHKSEEDYAAFMQAVGYAVTYGMANGTAGSDQFVNMSFDRDKEINVAYWPKMAADSFEAPYKGSAAQIISDACKGLQALSRGHVFVMGGIPPRPTDKKRDYSFHS